MKHPALTKEKSTKQFKKKTKAQQKLINETLEFLDLCGLPLSKCSRRRLERIAISFLALAGVTSKRDWATLESESDGRFLRTREIIAFDNKHYREQISPGSYDDVRREYLEWNILAGIVVSSGGSAQNDPSRGFGIADSFGELARKLGEKDWQDAVVNHMKGRVALATKLSSPRNVARMTVTLSTGDELELSPGKHNELQKAIVEEFLTRYGHNAEVLYIGDSTDKSLHLDVAALNAIKMFDLDHGKLPDVVAYSKDKGWLYLIEAFHSSGPMSPERVLVLNDLVKDCTVPVIYVTAFENTGSFRKNAHDIAWETEVWIADNPDHLVHYDGDKFLGPY